LTIKNARDLNLDERSRFRNMYTEYFDESVLVGEEELSSLKKMIKKFLFSRSERYALEMIRRIDDGSVHALVGFDEGMIVGFIAGNVDQTGGNIIHFCCIGRSYLRKRKTEMELLKAFSADVFLRGGRKLCAQARVSETDFVDTLTSLGFDFAYGSDDIDYYSRSISL